MNSLVQNRLFVAALAALLEPLIEQKLGIKLSDEQMIGLIGATPIAYHAIAAFAQKCVSAFVLYFPPPNSPGPTAPKA